MLWNAFIKDEAGAASVDWVLIAGLVVSMGFVASQTTATAMESLSHDIRAELTNTDPSRNYFDELMSMAVFAEYSSFAPEYGAGWDTDGVDENGHTWAQAAYNVYANFGNSELLAEYNAEYDNAVNGDPLTSATDAQSVDHIAVIEHILNDRGIDIPAGNLSADQVRDLYTST